MRFADASGRSIDVYQAATQMTDESGQSYPFTINTLLDRAIGPEGYYGAFVANMHTDYVASSGSDAIVSSASTRGIPVVTARQMLDWLDGRNASTFSSLSWNGNTLDFSISVAQGAKGLVAMVPMTNRKRITGITWNGSQVPFTTVRKKGVDYASFSAADGSYQITYEADVSPPVVSAVFPADGASGISIVAHATVTFSEAMDPATFSTDTCELRDQAGAPVPVTVTYDPATRTVNIAPAVLLANASTYTVTVKGGTNGVKDLAGNAPTNNVVWSYTTTAVPQAYSIWADTTVPGVVDSGPDNPLEVGVKFRADFNGYITGIRFYKASTNTGTHVGTLWTSSGTILATANFSAETASGWQQATFPTPVATTANTVYVASYHTSTGHYSFDRDYFTGRSINSPPLQALADGVSGANGVYAYGATGSFPNQGYNGSNYWVDVIFGTGTGIPSDTIPPTVTAFTIPATATILTVPISSFTATDNVGVAGYLVTESAAAPSATAAGWAATAPSSYTFTTAGSKILYAWAKDAAGNVSASNSANVAITLPADTTPPTVTAFTVPAAATSLLVSISSFSATDDVGVAGYLVTESAGVPLATAAGWSATPHANYSFATAGSKTVYAWAKDAAGNVSESRNATVTITLEETGVEPAGWFAGDMHVHRSCGGSPESLTSLYQKMSPQNLSIISLLADMGNGEVQNPVTDLPLVNGGDDSISTPGKIVHWDAEWHWDPIYYQYPFQALGGHVVALGLTEAHQIREEYTYQIFNWAHQQNAMAGFAHMQYLGEGIPQTLSCCTPIEYPVETALGASDFISEDVADVSASWPGMNPENFTQAYYRLLNCGFRPGFAAGTDSPCNNGRDLGSLLTYVQVPDGQMTYRNWIDGIANGRTVVSRNGHNEFLNLTVNNSATPGDEIRLTGGGTVQVTVQWTANQNLTGAIELVHNGEVVASKQASVSSGVSSSLTATVDFTKSGWLAARRMGSNGHQVHTAAVFVTVDNAPVRASVADAEFYVQWMDNLLEKTSPGGAWSSYFVNSRSAAQARYQTAKALYQQIALEAAAQGPLSITTTSLPGGATNVSYSATLSAGGGTSPYTWSISSGAAGGPDAQQRHRGHFRNAHCHRRLQLHGAGDGFRQSKENSDQGVEHYHCDAGTLHHLACLGGTRSRRFR